MNINIICVGKIKEKYFTEAINEYTKRLSRFAKIHITELTDLKIPANASAKEENTIIEKEGSSIIAKISADDYVIAMCIEGKEFSSTDIAEKISDILMRTSSITFIIGGSLGLSDAVKKRADLKMSFGPVTYPHQLMRVILLEQIYRAFKIINNETYHK